MQRFEEALRTEHPYDSLHQLAISLRDTGTSQYDLYLLFLHFFILVRDASPENEMLYDAVANNMDTIWGGPWAKGGNLFQAEIDKRDFDRYRQQA